MSKAGIACRAQAFKVPETTFEIRVQAICLMGLPVESVADKKLERYKIVDTDKEDVSSAVQCNSFLNSCSKFQSRRYGMVNLQPKVNN